MPGTALRPSSDRFLSFSCHSSAQSTFPHALHSPSIAWETVAVSDAAQLLGSPSPSCGTHFESVPREVRDLRTFSQVRHSLVWGLPGVLGVPFQSVGHTTRLPLHRVELTGVSAGKKTCRVGLSDLSRCPPPHDRAPLSPTPLTDARGLHDGYGIPRKPRALPHNGACRSRGAPHKGRRRKEGTPQCPDDQAICEAYRPRLARLHCCTIAAVGCKPNLNFVTLPMLPSGARLQLSEIISRF
jgi:hypothetical protein